MWYNKLMQEGTERSLLSNFFHNKWVLLFLCFNAILIIAVIAIAVYNNTMSAIITFNIAPIDAKISVNGNDKYKNGSFRFHPGKYNVVISRDGLDSKSFDLELDGYSSTVVTCYLSANNGDDFSFYEKNKNNLSALKLISMLSSDEEQIFDKDYSAKGFVSEYGAVLDAFNNNLPVGDIVRKSPDEGGELISNIIIQKDDSCSKYICVMVQAFGYEDVEKVVGEMLGEAGFNMKYVEVKYASNNA